MPTSTSGNHELGLGHNSAVRASRVRLPPTEHGPPIGSVLVATDFSKGAEMGIKRVRQLPLDRAAKITLVHVQAPEARGTAAESEAETRLHRDVEPLCRGFKTSGSKRVSVRTKLAHGHAFEELARGGAKVDLVVVGRHGAGKFIDMLLGSTAERVLRMAEAPVLIVGQKAEEPYRHPMVGVDLSPASRRALEFGLRLLQDAHVLEICHAYEPMFERALRRAGYGTPDLWKTRREERAEASKRLRQFLEDVGGGLEDSCRQLVRPGDPRVVLLDRAKRRRADLVVVGTQGRSGVARWILGSVAEAVVRNATCDVLIVPSRARERSE